MTSNEVVASLNHHLGEESKSAAKGILSGIVSVKVDGKHGVTVQLSGGDAGIIVELTSISGLNPKNSIMPIRQQ